MLATAPLMKAYSYDERTAHDDYEWQTRVAAAGARAGNSDEILLRRRHHSGQSNVVSRSYFMLERRRYRFRHFYRLFPRTPAREYQIVNGLADGARFEDRSDLESAGAWFHRLAEVPDPPFRRKLAQRWERLCAASAVAEANSLQRHFSGLILGRV
jgi:hypothetical protein